MDSSSRSWDIPLSGRRLEAVAGRRQSTPPTGQACWLSTWLNDKVSSGKVAAKEMQQGLAWIGGFLEKSEGPWFSLEVDRAWAPWAFAKGDPKKVIAALELQATLVGIRPWVPDRKTSRVAIRGYTDNKSNEALLKKAMTTKYPSMLVLMEIAEELAQKNCELQLQWIRRDINQLADDLTNEEFKKSSTPTRG